MPQANLLPPAVSQSGVMSDDPPLDDGRYDAFVIDAEDRGETVHLSITIVAGRHKGLVVELDAPRSLGADIDLMGMPATLSVVDGAPHVVIDG